MVGVVRLEGDHAAVVICVGLRLREEYEAAVGVGDVGIVGDGVAFENGLAALPRVVYEEETVRGVVGMEGNTEESALAAEGNVGLYIEEGCFEGCAVLDDHDDAALLDDEETVHVVGR